MFRIILLLLAILIGGWVAWPAFSAYQIYGGMKTADESVLRRKINWESMRTSLRPIVSGEVEKALADVGGGAAAKALMPSMKKKFMPQIVDMALKNIVTPSGLAQVMAQGGDVSSAVSSVVSKQIGKMGGLGSLGALVGGGGGGGKSSGGGVGGLIGGLLGGGSSDAKKGVGGLLGGLLSNKKVREIAGDKIGKVMGSLKKKPASKEEGAAPAKGPSYGLSNIKRFAYTGLGSMELGVAKDPAASGSDVTAVMEFQNFDWKLTGLIPRKR